MPFDCKNQKVNSLKIIENIFSLNGHIICLVESKLLLFLTDSLLKFFNTVFKNVEV